MLKRFLGAGLLLAGLILPTMVAAQSVNPPSGWHLASKAMYVRKHSTTGLQKVYNGFTNNWVTSYTDSAWSTHTSGEATRPDTLAPFYLDDLPGHTFGAARSAAAVADSFAVFRLVCTPIGDGPGVATSRGLTVAEFDTLAYTVQISMDGGSRWVTVDAARNALPASGFSHIDVQFNSKFFDISAATPTRVNFAALNPYIRFICRPGLDNGNGAFTYRLVYPAAGPVD